MLSMTFTAPGPPGQAPPQVGMPVPARGAGMTAQQRAEMQREMQARYRLTWLEALRSALPPELQERLALTAAARAVRRQTDPCFWPRWRGWVQQAVAGRANPSVEGSVRAWRGRSQTDLGLLTTETWLTRPGEAASVCGLVDHAGGWVAVTVPPDWLFDVWAHGLALVAGCFVLEVTDWSEYPERVRVLAARWERRLPSGSTPVVEEAVALRPEGEPWTLRWA
jgi:hypothetical protein